MSISSNKVLYLLIPILAVPSAVMARSRESFEFSDIWSMVLQGDPALKAVHEDEAAARIAAQRASSHWFPRIYAGAQVFSTNDPTRTLMLRMGQRRIEATDFTPNALNHPSSALYGQGSLGVDFALFEGGTKVAQANAARRGAESKKWASDAERVSEYGKAIQGYASVLALVEERGQLENLQESVTKVIEKYGVGSKSNPVGYSGLLGLRNLEKRIQGLLVQNAAVTQSHQANLRVLAPALPAEWSPKVERAAVFLKQVLPAQTARDLPALVKSARLGAEALDSAKEAQLSRFLPKVGLFAQGDLYAGSRSGATSYTGGAYLQWDLFSAPNFGAVAEAQHEASAAHARADLLTAKLESESEASLKGAQAATATLQLLDESAELLKEQTQVARELFRNGAINALQLTEVLNRRTDLLVNRREAELALTQAQVGILVSSGNEEALK